MLFNPRNNLHQEHLKDTSALPLGIQKQSESDKKLDLSDIVQSCVVAA
jgi:hypothetical protein